MAAWPVSKLAGQHVSWKSTFPLRESPALAIVEQSSGGGLSLSVVANPWESFSISHREMTHLWLGSETSGYREMRHTLLGDETCLAAGNQGNETHLLKPNLRIDSEKTAL
jgi:hypothetical protein